MITLQSGRKRARRKRSGNLALEVCLISIIGIVFFALGFDLVVGVWSFMILDGAARDAARVAANTESVTEALRMAKRAVDAHLTDGYFVSRPRLESTAPQFQFVTNPNNTEPPSGSPYVVVTATCNVRLPIKIRFFEAVLDNDHFIFKRSYSYPLLAVPFNLVPDNKPEEDPGQDWKTVTKEAHDPFEWEKSKISKRSPFSVPQLPPPVGTP